MIWEIIFLRDFSINISDVTINKYFSLRPQSENSKNLRISHFKTCRTVTNSGRNGKAFKSTAIKSFIPIELESLINNIFILYLWCGSVGELVLVGWLLDFRIVEIYSRADFLHLALVNSIHFMEI